MVAGETVGAVAAAAALAVVVGVEVEVGTRCILLSILPNSLWT